MRGDLLDLILVVIAAGFAVSGYRQGFVVGALSFVGFVSGGVLGARLAPRLADNLSGGDPAVIGLTLVLVLAILGQLVGVLVGGQLRRRVTWQPARVLDNAGGAVISVVSLLLVAWLLASAVASSSYPRLASQVRRSVVIASVDAVVPDVARRALNGFRQLIDDRGFPDVFDSLDPTDPTTAAPPDPALAASAVVQSAREDVLKITGTAESCSRRIEGTGFVYAPGRVMTNAHVVAGVDSPQVEVDGGQLDAQVVLFDPQRDIAVLRVPGLPAGSPLVFRDPADPAEPGDDAVVLGYPQDGPFRADAARVRETQRARGPDIYGNRTVVREIYALRGLVQPGNSGGPLIGTDGQVLGVIFAAAADRTDTGYALTAAEVAPDAAAGARATRSVDTQDCD